MSKTLRALIHGSGYAGQGHVQAFRDNGVEIVGMVSRTESVLQDVTDKLGIPYASTDWDAALAELQPDMVIIGTPGGVHYEPVMAALEQGCHVFCDKPLTTSADRAKQLYVKAREQGVKTAFAASYRYQPHVLLAKELVAQGVIGEPQEVECISHYNMDPFNPWGWSHRIELGGGRLSNNFTHKLSIVQQVLNGKVLRINGETRNDLRKAPVIDGVHDFRDRKNFALTRDEVLKDATRWEWRDVDAEWSYSVIGRMEAELSVQDTVSLLFKHSGMQPRFNKDYVAFYGSEGIIHIEGAYAQGPLHLYTRANPRWEEVACPDSIIKALPQIEDDTLRNWTCLAGEFVEDILGRGYAGYQTFREGWIYQEIVDAIRRADGWFEVPEDV